MRPLAQLKALLTNATKGAPTTYAPAVPTARDAHLKRVMFFRDFRRFSGGHLKVWDYYNHVLTSGDHLPLIRFSTTSVWDQDNPWMVADLKRVSEGDVRPDVLFLAGRDWENVAPEHRDQPQMPVVNLIQHVRHADPKRPQYAFLQHPAIRICVGPEITDAVSQAGVRGPIFTIPNGIDIDALGDLPQPPRDIDLLIAATKQPEMGKRLAEALVRSDRQIVLLDSMKQRIEFLEHLRRSKVTLFLPNLTEGFYLPALEGMVLGTVVVCPDCVGNRSFCRPGETALRPPYREADLLAAAEQALAMPEPERASIIERASGVAQLHALDVERERFLAILRRVDDLWDV